MRWIANTQRPEQATPNGPIHWPAETSPGVMRQWLADKHIGRPQAREGLSVEDLEAMGLVGVYAYDE